MSVSGEKVSNRASVKEQAAIDRLLHEHCKQISEGLCRYADGWSDAEVAKVAGIPGKLMSVTYRRTALYGKFAPKAKPADPALAPIIEAVNYMLLNMGESKRLVIDEAGALVFANDPPSTAG